ncbi:hypothetical protein HYG81_14505 [Natrinema zhouii]|uniref:hypothetical protein n=1 Tax=Natrinema zhouii TaxID=1710539 RepID=UPI001CF7DD5B|nr:hypothetical protein [Natrinema zhouii]UHQ97916.1 hypothetical protein HYG81_14505 [Natrinema zhouii]
MTHHTAAHDRVALHENPLEEPDEYDALTSGDATRRIPTVRPRDAAVGRTTSTHVVRERTDDCTADGGTPQLAMIP